MPRGRAGARDSILGPASIPLRASRWFLARLRVPGLRQRDRSSIATRESGTPGRRRCPTATRSCCSTRSMMARCSIPTTHFSNGSNNEHPSRRLPTPSAASASSRSPATQILGGAGPIGQYSSPAARNRVDDYFLLDTAPTHARQFRQLRRPDAGSPAAWAFRRRLEPLYRGLSNATGTRGSTSAPPCAICDVAAGWRPGSHGRRILACATDMLRQRGERRRCRTGNSQRPRSSFIEPFPTNGRPGSFSRAVSPSLRPKSVLVSG